MIHARAKAPKFEDFLKPNPYVRSWMLPYLPIDRRSQDMSILFIGSVLLGAIAILLHWLGVYDLVAGGIWLVGLAFLSGDYKARNMIAGAKYARAKREFEVKVPQLLDGSDER